MKNVLVAFILALLVCGLFFVCSPVQGATEFSGVISSDTTWTKANSPYTITAKTLIKNGVTLTIEPGVTVNMNFDSNSQIYLQVEGTLIAKGSNSEKIYFNGGKFKFTTDSVDYNELTDSGCIIENAVITSNIERCLTIQGCSPKIANNVINCQVHIENCSPRILNNHVTGGIYVNGGEAVFSKNTITNKGITVGSLTESQTILISENTIMDCDTGIQLYSVGAGPFNPSALIIEKNLIKNNRAGISMGVMMSPTIRNNTIINNREVGLRILDFKESNYIIKFNNFANNGKYNLFLSQWSALDIDATNNWWGTTDIATISASIYDFKNNFDLGTVNFTPFLSEPNPNAPDATDLPTTPTFNPTPTVSTPTSMSPTTPSATIDANYFNIESNSTVSAFSFDAGLPQVSFIVSGPDGTSGYVKITIAKAFMPTADNMQVYLDGNPIGYSLDLNAHSWIVAFTYQHSSHQVTINSAANEQEVGVPSWIWDVATVAVAVGLIVAAVIFVWLARKRS